MTWLVEMNELEVISRKMANRPFRDAKPPKNLNLLRIAKCAKARLRIPN